VSRQSHADGDDQNRQHPAPSRVIVSPNVVPSNKKINLHDRPVFLSPWSHLLMDATFEKILAYFRARSNKPTAVGEIAHATAFPGNSSARALAV
jgi:hypothetical protein